MAVFKGGQQIDTMYPGAVVLPQTRKRADDGSRHSSCHRRGSVSGARGEHDGSGSQNAQLTLFVNPLVDWIWVGFGVMAIGTGIALLPERSFEFAMAKMPGDAAATTVALLLALFLGTAGLSRTVDGRRRSPRAAVPARVRAFETQMQHEIVCIVRHMWPYGDRGVQKIRAPRPRKCARIWRV